MSYSSQIAPLKKQIVDIIKDYENYCNKTFELDAGDKETYLNDYKQETTISGWVREFRSQTENVFISLTDGSTHSSLQVFASKSVIPDFDNLENIRGACIQVSGHVVKSPAKGQLIELVASNIKIIGEVQDKKSILLAKKVNLETLRGFQHLRSRFRSYNYIYKIRSTLLKNIHEFFHLNNFYNLDPNVITTSDCEGAGEVFTITSLNIQDVKTQTEIATEYTVLNKHLDAWAGHCITDVNEEKKLYDALENKNILTDNVYKKDFFEKQAFLTVSSQLQLEALCAGLSRVYTLNPSFRAEKSRTKRHLCSFTHLEWEIAFIDINDLMNFSQSLIKYVIGKTLTECAGEYAELDSFMSKGIIDKLTGFINCEFERITYTKAIELIELNKKSILKKFSKEGMGIKDIPAWGDDLGSFCERFICEEIYKKPTFIYDYPKDLKSFYMKQSEDDSRCVNAVDLVLPYLGELIGSSIRENSYEKLVDAMEKRGMDKSKLEWYLELRRVGGCITGGAGLGFDRLVNVCTLMDGNIRDVVPFPVAYQECDY
jgi:asparaginyl-tRNA synthetase